MFESIIASFLNKYLSEYIDSVDYNNLSLGLNFFKASGSFELKNVKIKPSALYQFDLPIEVKYGKIGKLKINLPMKNIYKEPTQILVEDLFVLLGPFEDKLYDPKRVEEIFVAYKRKQLSELEKFDKAQLVVDSNQKGFTETLQDTIINNIYIHVQNVHVRYEDKYSIKGKTISFGIYLEEFITQTVNEKSEPYFSQADDKIIYKVGHLKGLNVYWNCDMNDLSSLMTLKPEFKDTKNKDFCSKHLKESILTGKLFDKPFGTFLKRNLDLKANLVLRRTYQKEDFNNPKISFKSDDIRSIEFSFHRRQFKSIIELIDCYSLLSVHKKFVKYRPKESDRKAGKADLWWKYIFTATSETKWRSYRRERIANHWKYYKEYLAKYEKKLETEHIKKTKLTEAQIKELELLESYLNLESIFDARNYCKEKLKSKLDKDNDPTNDTIIDTVPDVRPRDYVEFCLGLKFPLIRLKLINAGSEILRIDFTEITTKFETRPVANNIYFSLDTRGIEVLGIYYNESLKKDETTNEMVTLVSSRHKTNEEAAVKCENKLLTFSFETNPIKIENAEFSIETKVSSLEIFYEKTSITEILRFFKTDLIDFEEYANLGKKLKDNVWSTAGLIFAVDNHKQFHVKAELSSPYFIIPVNGTSKQIGNQIVFFLGKTLIQSELQPKRTLSSTSVEDLEKNFYDKLNLTVNDIQVMLVPSSVNLSDYLSDISKYGYTHHLLYPVSTENTLYLSINPKYKKLPKAKIDARCPSIHLNFSDNKIIKLADFLQKLPLPEMPKTPAPQFQRNQISRNSRQSVQMDRLPNFKSPQSQMTTSTEQIVKQAKTVPAQPKANSQNQEPDDEWEGAFRLPKDINGDPIPNYTHLLLKFTINDFSVDLKGTDDHLCDEPVEKEYLNFIFNHINMAFAITKYGFNLKASLGNLKLVDKIHLTDRLNPTSYTEILSSTSSKELIRLNLRQVDKEAPNFSTLYLNTVFSVLFKFRSIQLVAHRTGIIYFLKYGKKIVDNINIASATESPSADVVSRKEEYPLPSSNVAKKIYEEDMNRICDFNVEARMSELKWKMFDSDLNFGLMEIKELGVAFKLSGIKTDMNVKLKTIYVVYEAEYLNVGDSIGEMKKPKGKVLYEPYKQIISCTADQNAENFFDFKLIFYDTSNLRVDKERKDRFKDSIQLNIGKIKLICLVKFVNELIAFIDPIITFIEPVSHLGEQISDFTGKAVNKAVNIYQETQTEDSTKQIMLYIDISSPIVVIPQNSTSIEAFLVELGNLVVSNKFVGEKNCLIDEIKLDLTDVKVKRIRYLPNKKDKDIFKEKESLISPINVTTYVKRTVTSVNASNLAKLTIIVKITNLDSCISLGSAQLLFAILDENLTEGGNMNAAIDQPVVPKSLPEQPPELLPEPIDKPDSNIENKDMELFVELNEIRLKIIEFIVNNQTHLKEAVDFSLLLISRIEFNFLKYNSVQWDAFFKMKALRLSDLRPESNLAVKEMFLPIDTNNYFLDLTYSNKTAYDSFLDFKIDYLHINLCLPYILKLYQMTMEAINSPNKQPEHNKHASAVATQTTKNKPVKPHEPDTQTISSGITSMPTQKTVLTATAKINLPHVVLFAEPANPDSMILFMNLLIGLKFVSNSQGLDLTISMDDLAIRLGENKKAERHGIPFLSPCHAVLKMKQKSGEKIGYYKAKIESLYFNMTPTLYKVVMGVINTLNMTGTEKKQIEEENKELLIEASEPLTILQVKEENTKRLFSFVSIDPEADQDDDDENDLNNNNNNNDLNEITGAEQLNKLTELLEALDLEIEKAFITFCEETGVDLQPLAVVKLKVDSRIANWTNNLHCKADIFLEASYYNDRLSNWEPLIENIMEKEDDYRPWLLKLWFALSPSRIMQPPVIQDKNTSSKARNDLMDFPVPDLDYTHLNRVYINSTHVVSATTDYSASPDVQRQISAAIVLANQQHNNAKLAQKTASYVQLKSEDILLLNVTPSAYKVIMYLTKIIAGTDKDKVLENQNKAQLKFLNFLNEASTLTISKNTLLRPENAKAFQIKYHNASDGSFHFNSNNNSQSQKLRTVNELNNRIENIIQKSQRSQIDTFTDDKYKFDIQVSGFEPNKLSLKTDGSYLIKLTEQNAQHNGQHISYNMMYRVRTSYGRTKVLFSSPLQIENNSQLKLFIMIEITENIKDELKQNSSRFNFIREIEFSSDLFENASNPSILKRIFGVVFLLEPAKVYYVPLYYAYKCKLYAAPQNLKYAPSLVFDIRGYNLRRDDINEVVCKRLNLNFDLNTSILSNSTSSTLLQTEDIISKTNDFQLMRQLSLNVELNKHVMPTMHANYKVHLFSPIKLFNSLPFDIRIDMYGKSDGIDGVMNHSLINSIEATSTDPASRVIRSGENLHINMNIQKLTKFKIHISDYLNINWDHTIDWHRVANSKSDNFKFDFSPVISTETHVSAKQLIVHMIFKKPNEYTLYSPYWLVNKSGQLLEIKSVDSPQRIFDVPNEAILLFDYRNSQKKNFIKMRLKSNGSKWSSAFSLDTVGTTGMIDCKDQSQEYTFLMRSTLSNSSWTKLITFAPFLSVVNQLEEQVELCEKHMNRNSMPQWKRMQPGETSAFWLTDRESVPCLMLKLNSLMSEPFPLQNPSRFVLMLKETNSSINQETIIDHNLDNRPKICTVVINGGNTNPVTIIIRNYNYGDSVAKLVNLCEQLRIQIKYDENKEAIELEPSKLTYFVWPFPTRSKKYLRWTVNECANYESLDLTSSSSCQFEFNVDVEDHIENSNSKEFSEESFAESPTDTKNLIDHKPAHNRINKKNAKVSCVSYMDGTQRIVLFTTNHSLADMERKKESASMEVFTSFKGLEISVINNVNLELATISIESSRPVWTLETTGGITLSFTSEYSNWIEAKYNHYLLHSKEESASKIELKNLEINFATMETTKFQIGNLKRMCQPGLSCLYQTSNSMMSLKCSIQRLQIDNQLPDAYFPICFYKAPSLLSTASKANPQPFITLDMFTEQQEMTQIYRYFKCSQHEFFLKVDKGFLFSLWDWYEAAITTTNITDKLFGSKSQTAEQLQEPFNILVISDEDEKLTELMQLDKRLIMEIMEYATHKGNLKQSSQIRFDDFCLSPLICNLSFSVNGKAHTDDKVTAAKGAESVLQFFLESVGSTITEFKDVKFQFHSFEIINGVRTWTELYEDLLNHYKIQALHQTYALLLGLDVLGNPFGLVTNVSQGLTDLFYDPLLVPWKKDEDNSESLQMGLKIKETVNKTISYLAGSGSLITGSVGRVLATCTFDSEYKKKRQYKLSKSSTWKLSETLKFAAKGVALGTYEGVTGFVKKPIQEGPFPGIGKGIVGLFAKPFGSVFDGVSLSLGGLKRFSQQGSESIQSIRLPRHLISDVAILPYSEYLAKGYEILRDLQNDNIAEEEFYWSHMFTDAKKSCLIFITDQNILKLRKTRLDIRTKWKLTENGSIPIKNILRTEIFPFKKISDQFNMKQRILFPVLKKTAQTSSEQNKQENTKYDLNVQYDSQSENKSETLFTSDLETVSWLSEKINSIVKYKKETRKIQL